MPLPRFFRWLIWLVAGMIGLVLSLLVFLTFIKIPVDLTSQKNLLEWAASRSLGRRVFIDGKVIVSTSLWPSIRIEGVRLANPERFAPGDFVLMKSADLSVGIIPLLKWKVHIREFTVKGVVLTLVENENEAVNWAPHPVVEPVKEIPEKEKPKEGRIELTSDTFVLEMLSIEDIAVSYQRPDLKEPIALHIDTCRGSALVGEPFVLSITGRLHQEPFDAAVKMGSLKEFIEENKSWSDIELNIAKTRFELAGLLDLSQSLRKIDLKTSVQGDRLDSLNGVLELDLPPLSRYRAQAVLSGRRGRIDLSDFEIRVGESQLTGKMFIEETGPRASAFLELTAPRIQLNDFVFENWSFASGGKGGTGRQETGAPKETAAAPERTRHAITLEDERIKNLLSHDFLAEFDASITIKAESVLSGKDKLGSGLMTATLKEGRFSIDPIRLNIPGGSFLFGLSFKPGVESSDGTVRVEMKNFDFGILARRARPDTNMGGTLNLDVSLKSKARDWKGLLTNASGYMDFSGNPENLQAGILDVWAVNLIAAISDSAASKDKGAASKINCVICRWSVLGGILRPDAFMIDTNKVRICGEGEVDFKKEQIDLVVAPTPKRPEFFSLATPLAVRGSFSEFKMGIQSGGLVGTVIRFVTSPFAVPFARIIDKGLPENGGDVCGMGIGPDNRPKEPLPGCMVLRAK
jgi:AsmA family protein